MRYVYEKVQGEEGLSLKTIIHSVDGFYTHWHNEIEFLLVLKGSIQIRIGTEVYDLKENDVVLVNCNELHSTRKSKDENILLVVQINPDFYNRTIPDFSKMRFNCKSFEYEEEEQKYFNVIRHYMAKILWELNKKDLGYEFRLGSYLYILGNCLLNNFEYELVEEEDRELRDTDLSRLKRIMEYVNDNFHNKITLKEIAQKEHLNYYYLSHFIKAKLGMSFQEYLNTIRLDKAIKLLRATDMSIIDISTTSGFANINSFNNLFKDNYNITPTEFRKNEDYKIKKDIKKSKSYLDVDRDIAFKKLFTYLELKTLDENKIMNRQDIKFIEVDSKKEGKYFKNHWQNLTTFSRAHEGLRSNLQRQLIEVQREIGFNYIRCHGIFMDEMMVYNLSPEGEVEYNWTYVDELFDFFIQNNLRPFVELSFMPEELKRSNETIFWWKGSISPPKDIELWIKLVQDFIGHCINRYGIEEVKTWYFEVWNEPEFEYVFWAGTKEEYFKFYKETGLEIKSISEDLRVGGPSTTHGSILGSSWLDEFLKFCKDEEAPLDFLSIHIYSEYISEESAKEAYELIESGVDFKGDGFQLKKIYHEENHVLNTINMVNSKLENILNNKIEVHVTEWNASSEFGNLIHDTSYISAYIIKNVLQTIGKVESLGYWTFTDLIEEFKLGVSHFHGGFGLINKDGIKKPSYYAFYLLSKLGNEIIAKGEDYIITRKGDHIQILAYNYVHFDDLFMTGDVSHINHNERYMIYKDEDEKHLEFNISNIKGNYKITKYKLDRKNGSAFDEWKIMGLPEHMTIEEIEYLKGKSKPKIIVENLKIHGGYKDILNIPVHGVEMIVLEQIY